LKQDLIPPFERMEINLNNAAIMVNALCEAEGIDVASVISDVQDQSSSFPSPHLASDVPLQLEWSNQGIGG
jgi:hypothetical protein